MSNTEKMRRDFEAFVSERYGLGTSDFVRDAEIDTYESSHLENDWEFWQAATERATASQWQPIATAPKDIERILVFGVYPELPQEPPSVYTASYGFTTPYFDLDPSPHEEEYNTVQLTSCTHWMPLPPPPAIQQGGAV